MDGLTAMLYSVIRQLIWLLPETVDTTLDLSFERFYSLDGSTGSLPSVFNLMEELLYLMPKLLVCVIDAFDLVDNDTDDDGTCGYLGLFWDILRQAERDRVSKVLISSAGLCRTLLDEEICTLNEQLHIVEDYGEDYYEELIDRGIFDYDE